MALRTTIKSGTAHKRLRWAATLAAMAVGVTMALAGSAFADTLNTVNEVALADDLTYVSGEPTVVITKPSTSSTFSVKYVLTEQGSNGCNVTPTQQGTLAFTGLPAGVTATGGLTWTSCTTQLVTFTVQSSVATGTTTGITPVMTGGKTGGEGFTNHEKADFTLVVNNPSDATAPDTAITANPSNPSNSSSASFSFTGSDNVTSAASLTFECMLDGGAWGACTSPKSYSSLTEGSHTFSVRAKDGAGNLDPTPASYTWVVDTVAPNTSITASPAALTNSTSASFSFSSTESGSTFECKLDLGAWGACTSPKSYSSLTEGSHTLSVRATDAAGNLDASPAEHTWYVDLTPPETQIDSNPTALTNATSATFTFSGTDDHSPSVTFECKLDAGSYEVCTSAKTYSGLADGSHTFSVRAKDGAGNVDPTPASYTWVVDATAPETSIDSNPVNPNSSTSASFSFSGTDNHSAASALTFECKLDLGAWGACTSPKSYTGLSVGSHTLQVRATDEAGNTDVTPASYTWSIQYVFNGFFQPVDNKMLNGMKAGSTAPIKFQLSLDGQLVTSTSAITKASSGVMACDESAPVDNLEEYATGTTSLRYDSTNSQFIYNWQSPKQPGKCYKVVLTFADGTSHSASFTLR